MALDEPVDRARQQLGRGVGRAVPGDVVLGVLQSKVGPKVDHLDTAGDEPGHVALALAVRQGEEGDVEFGLQRGLGALQDERRIGAGEGRNVLADSVAGVGLTRGDDDIEVRVSRAEAQHLGPRVARRSEHPDSHTAILCIQPSKDASLFRAG